MGWFWGTQKVPALSVLQEEIEAVAEKFPLGLKRKLKLLDFAQSWELTKMVSPHLSKTKMRNLVRLLWGTKIDEVIAQLDNKQDLRHALLCLQYLPSRQTVEALTGILLHQDKMVQILAAAALKNCPPRLVVPFLQGKFLKGEVPPARAGEILLAMGYLAQDALLAAYEAAETPLKAQILELLTVSQNPKCERFLAQALQNEDPALRKAALQAVSVFLLRDLWADVAPCLEDPAWSIRVKSLEIFTRLKVRDVLEMVRPLLADTDPWVRKAAGTYFEVLKVE